MLGVPCGPISSGLLQANKARHGIRKSRLLPQNIFLVGFMASGKTEVGGILSRLTGWELVDADDEIERRAGRSVQRIFEEDGEEAFRNLERAVTQELCAASGKVIAAGGGAFVDPGNRRRMLENGLVVWLSAQPETIHRRVIQSQGTASVRPLLAGDDPLDRIRTLLSQRAEAYGQAHHTVETDNLTPEQVARAISDATTELPPRLECDARNLGVAAE